MSAPKTKACFLEIWVRRLKTRGSNLPRFGESVKMATPNVEFYQRQKDWQDQVSKRYGQAYCCKDVPNCIPLRQIKLLWNMVHHPDLMLFRLHNFSFLSHCALFQLCTCHWEGHACVFLFPK